MKTHAIDAVILAAIIGFATWLYSSEKAAEPGRLSSAHESLNDCRACHVPWKGVEDRMCLQCHPFDDVTVLKPQLRFHEAGRQCLSCHTEHRGTGAEISRMDHTLLYGGLECAQCHVDPHAGKFGNDCRACHRIATWRIEGFRHPAGDSRYCHRCHQAPKSHYQAGFWEQIREGHEMKREVPPPSPDECRRCHIPHRWDHLRMGHDL